MSTFIEAIEDFLAQKRIAVVGVSRSGDLPANAIYRKLRQAGYEVFAINPNAQELEGDPCYPNLAAVPRPLDGVVIATHPTVTAQITRDCARLGIRRVWIHRSFGQGSLSEEAVDYCLTHNITVIPGGCPMMFCEPVDFGHKCIHWFLNLTGGLPKGSELEQMI